MKTCGLCRKFLSDKHFNHMQGRCRKCQSASSKEYYRNHKEEVCKKTRIDRKKREARVLDGLPEDILYRLYEIYTDGKSIHAALRSKFEDCNV